MTANWESKSGQQWTVPVGGGVGKLGPTGPPVFLAPGDARYEMSGQETSMKSVTGGQTAASSRLSF